MKPRKKLIIIGAGAFGRELLGWARDIPASRRDWEPWGFLDPDPAALAPYPCDIPVIGDEDNYQINTDDLFCCAVTEPKLKLPVCGKIKKKGGKFISIIHPTAIVGSNCVLGEGCIVCPNAILTNNVKIGNFVTVNISVGIGHDCRVGDGCTLHPGSQIGGWSILEEGVLVGSNASVIQRKKIGTFARIGSGSAVVRNVKAKQTVFGVPAKVLIP